MSTFQSSTPMPISYWLTKLPKEYAELARANYNRYVLDRKVGSLSLAITFMDIWSETNEGHEFWYAVLRYADGIQSLPELSNTTNTPKPPEPSSKPISEWLKELPEPYYMLAIKNYGEDRTVNAKAYSLDGAIRHMGDWRKTQEGVEFWRAVCSWANKESPNLPKIPTPHTSPIKTIMPDRTVEGDVVEMFIKTPKPPTRIQETVESETPESLAQIIVDQEKLIHSLQDRIKCADNALGRASKFAKKLKAKVKHLKRTHRDKGDGISICLTEIQSILNKANQINQQP